MRSWSNIFIDNIILDDIINANNDEIITILNEIEKLYLINGCSQIAYDEKQHISSNHKNIRPWQLIDSIGKKDNIYSIKKIEYLQYIGYQVIPLVIILYNFKKGFLTNITLLFKNRYIYN